MDEEKLAIVKRSSYRIKVLKTLNEHPKIPKTIARDCDILQNHISNVLTYLKNMGLVICINPDAKKGRIYKLSEEGQEMIKYL